MEGDWQSGQRGDDSEPERITVIEFPDMDALHKWYNSPDYADLKAIRRDSTVSDAIAVASGRTP